MEGEPLLPIHNKPKTSKKKLLALIPLILLVGFIPHQKSADLPTEQLCPIVDSYPPPAELYNADTLDKLLHDNDTKLKLAEKLSGAIKIPTEVYDDMINPKSVESNEELYQLEPLWKNFELFHDYLEKTYPLTHENLKLDKVNKFALVYTWEGSDTTKKPLMLTAHQDVVPVQKETIDRWDFPPFEGHIKDGEIYGRGVLDCKNLLTGLMDTVELLISEGFKPSRTLILAFGYDEESQGTGAEEISKFLLNKYGKDSMYQIIDEGGGGFVQMGDLRMITPATAEKGHLDSIIEIYTPGGHSSVPPEHTSIGILSELIGLIESKPFDSVITQRNPVLSFYQCIAEHGDVDKSLKSDILNANVDKNANRRLLDVLRQDLKTKYLVTTSQAADIISGGAKSNALPEHAQVLVNQRIAVEESVESASTKILDDIKIIAKKYNLGIYINNKEIFPPTDFGYFNYTLSQPLEPAPVTPTDSDVWNVFGGSLRYFYQELAYPEDNSTYIFAPYLSTGNTDTKCYWDLTPHIFRYMPALLGESGGVHSVNERGSVDTHAAVVAFYYFYIPVIDSLQ
ncbi:carboxypeptidase S [[Candida] jaroonii]|uniref:Carboxypeptidase S n=1 Tax=[Candida] jaroonii TaxID=467808 RepID=A0ACA9YBC3_9ASCO|nr:carboxypeptidase S [[Candida] jaroonii]